MQRIKLKSLFAVALSAIFMVSLPGYSLAQVRLVKDQSFVVPTDGWFFTEPQEKKIRFRLIEADYLEKTLLLTIQLNENLETRLQLHTKAVAELEAQQLATAKVISELNHRYERNRWLYLLLGIGLTLVAGSAIGVAAWGLSK